MSLPLRVISLLLILAVTESARADFFIHHWDNQHEQDKNLLIAPEFSFYRSVSNYDQDGRLMLPAGLTSYSRIQGDLRLAFGIHKRVTAYLRGAWARIEVEHATRGGYVFGLTDQTAGLNVRVFESSYGGAIDLQAQGDFPAYNNTQAKNAGLLFMGDGSIDATGGLFITWPLLNFSTGRLNIAGGGGYTYRTQSFAHAFPWSLSFAYAPRLGVDGIFVSFGSSGVVSRGNDPLAGTVTGSSGSSDAGGSFMVNAINPTLITLRAQLGYRITRSLAIAASGSQTAWGLSAPHGWMAMLGLQARLDFSSSSAAEEKDLTTYNKANQGFVNYAFDGRVTKVNDRLNRVRIDKGSQDGVEKGQVFDIFSLDQKGSPAEAVARGRVTSVKSAEAEVQVTETFREVWIEEGFVVKRPIQ